MAIDRVQEELYRRHEGPGAPTHIPAEESQDARAKLPAQLKETELHLDDFAGRLGTSGEGFLDFSHKHPLPSPIFDPNIIVLFLWPPGLYIPGTADWHNYWVFPPPDSNRYTMQWLGGNGASANHSSAATGELFAYAAAAPTDTHLRSEASVGFVFQPESTLAVYTITVTPALTGSDRYDVNTTANAGGSVRKWGALDVEAFLINPIDGTTELVTPFGTTFLFDETFSNLTGTPINTFSLNKPVSTQVLLQGGGRRYVIGVTALVQIDNSWTMNNGAPMQPLPPGSTWKMWCSIYGTIASISIVPTTIYQK